MNIELKNIKHTPSLSHETEAFTASIYVNGIHAGYAENAGHGGETSFKYKDEKGKVLLKQAEEFAISKSSRKIDDPLRYYAFESMLNDLLEEHLKKKDIENLNKKIEKTSENAVVVGGVSDYSFSYFKLRNPVSAYLVTPERVAHLKNFIKGTVIPQLENGEKILNKNIPEKLLLESGLKKGQYAQPKANITWIENLSSNNEQQAKRGR